ncbi:AI-2E family transporter [Paracoccus cavernae]|uniref:AI-2E family transporter n=1 Tax=Paracoccus cavernae TaxID=1571207 RepID=A0ABT8D3J1_9RHOB|nr:AI-2E family transporter [Paracoccus cavernae]
MAPNQPQNASREETVLNGTAGPQIVALSEGDGGEIIRLASWLIVAAILIGGLYVGQDVLIPLAISFLISFAMSPLVNWLTRRGLSRVLSVCVVMLTVGVFIAGLALLVTSQVRTISAELPTYQTTIRAKISDLASQMKGPGILDGALETVDTVQKEVDAAVHGQGEDAAQKVEVVPPPVSPFQTAQEWLTPAMAPLATTGIVLVFVFLVLLDRGDLRDRLIRLMGGNLHRSTDALEEAGRRISKYLLMQILVNIIYAIPMGLGLWLIGVPGALLWATLAAFMRFIPYVGPMLSALFPLSLAFAVDPGWNMVIWTLVLVVGLEAISGNVIEPMLYGTSTGLSAIALIAAATFWTALWGPVGLILSTPLTVCLLVIGRNLRQLQFLEILLGSEPVLDLPTRIYQRLIADDPEEAIEIASEAIAASSVAEFYNDTGIAVLRRTSEDYHLNAGPEHRLRVANGMETLLEELQEDFPAKAVEEAARNGRARIACIGGKWEIDATACVMLGHALALEGYPSMSHREGEPVGARARAARSRGDRRRLPELFQR